jgi:hypothetical protein
MRWMVGEMGGRNAGGMKEFRENRHPVIREK